MSGGFFENLLGNLGLAGGAVGGGLVGGTAGAGTGGVLGTVIEPGGGTLVGAGYGAWEGAILGGSAGAASGYVGGKAAGEWVDQTGPGKYVNQKVDDLRDWITGDKAADKADAKASTITCATCEQNPCAKYACGGFPPSSSKYKGGAHGCMKLPIGDGLDSHHMPADSKSPLNREVGPAIQMEPDDHALTASYKGRVNGPTYAVQRTLLSQGKAYAAFLVDVADAKRVAAMAGDPGRYDGAIAQATTYATCLKQHSIIQ